MVRLVPPSRLACGGWVPFTLCSVSVGLVVYNLVTRQDEAAAQKSEAAIRQYQQANAMQLRAEIHRRQVESEKVKDDIKRKYKDALLRQEAALRESMQSKRARKEEAAARESIAAGIEPPSQWVLRHPLYVIPPPVMLPQQPPAPPQDRALP